MNMTQLRYALTLAEELHFRRTADRIHLSQPALSRVIQQIEEDLGFALFERTRRNVALTQAGARYLEGCRCALEMLDDVELEARDIATGRAGQIRIGYTDIAVVRLLPRIVQTFRQVHPDIRITATHGCSEAQIADLANGRLDLGILTGPWSASGYGTRVLQRDALVAILPSQHILARKPTLRLTDLAQEPFVLGEPRFWTHFHAHLFASCRKAGFEPRVVQHASNNEGIVGLVACGMGVSVQAQSVGIWRRGDVVIRPVGPRTPFIPTLAAWRTQHSAPATRQLIDHLASIYPAATSGAQGIS